MASIQGGRIKARQACTLPDYGLAAEDDTRKNGVPGPAHRLPEQVGVTLRTNRKRHFSRQCGGQNAPDSPAGAEPFRGSGSPVQNYLPHLVPVGIFIASGPGWSPFPKADTQFVPAKGTLSAHESDRRTGKLGSLFA